MNTSLRTRSIIATLAIGAIAPVAPAAASSVGPVSSSAPPIDRPDPGYSSLNATVSPSSDSTAGADASGTLVLRKVGPVSLDSNVDHAEPTTVASSAGDDGFDWGDAGLGAAAMTALVALGAAGLLASRRRTGISHA